MASNVRFVPKSGAGRLMCELPGVGSETRRIANSIQSKANAMLSPDGYSLEGFQLVELEMNGHVVRTKTDHARCSESRNKTLTKAFNSSR